MNYLPNGSDKGVSFMFADESNIFTEGNDMSKMLNELNTKLIKI